MRFLLALLFFFSLSAEAATTYFCACETNSDPSCVAGSDANPGSSPSAPKQTETAIKTAWAAGAAGDQILLGQGCAWDNFNMDTQALTSTLAQYIANPLVFSSYSSPNFTSSARPILNMPSSGCAYGTSTCIGFNFNRGATATRWGGYVFSNLDLRGNDTVAQQGIQLYTAVENVKFSNVSLTHFDNAFGCSNLIGNGTYGSPSEISFVNGTVQYTLGIGLPIYGCNNVLLDGNTIDHTATASKDCCSGPGNKSLDHAIYMSGNESINAPGTTLDTYGNVIRNNTITNTCLGSSNDATRCSCAIITGHARIDGWTVENNRLIQAAGTDNGLCYGISIAPGNNNGTNEFEKRYVIRGNVVVNTGNIGIGTTACANCLIENNVVVKEDTWDNFVGISVTQMPFAIVFNNSNVTIRGNSVYIANVNDVSAGITLSGTSMTGGIVGGNLIVYGSAGANGGCYGDISSTGSYSAWNYNLCYNAAKWNPTYANRSAFNSATGFDANSLSSDPSVTVPSSGNNYSMAIPSGSTARGAGSSSSNLSPPKDITTCTRNSPPAIGAYDYYASACGTKPAGSGTQVR